MRSRSMDATACAAGAPATPFRVALADGGELLVRPSRMTVAFCGTISESASIARPALNSWIKPIMALITTTASTTKPSVVLPKRTASVPEPSSTQIRGLLICPPEEMQHTVFRLY